MMTACLRRALGALDARPDLERAARLAVVLGFLIGWLWHQLVWPSDAGLLVLGAAGVAFGVALGALGGLAARRRPWVGPLQVLGLPTMVVATASGYAALQLIAVELVERDGRLGLPPDDALQSWRLVGWGVALLAAAGWVGATARLVWLARALDAGPDPPTPPVEQRLILAAARWLGRRARQPPQWLFAQQVERRSPARRLHPEAPADDATLSQRGRRWLIVAHLLIGWPPQLGRRR